MYYIKNLKKGENKNKKENITQEWLPFDDILENGIIISKNSYIKIIKINPINYNLKSTLEKEAILNSYKLFLKTCNFNIQIIIQSKKEDLSKHFYNLEKISEKEENKKIKEITQNYVEFIKNKNNENKSASKNFYIVIKYDVDTSSKENNDISINKNIAINFLNESFFKIKEALSRCGNTVYDINTQKESEEILSSFFNPTYNSNQIKMGE